MTAFLKLLDLVPAWVWALALAVSMALNGYLTVRLQFAKAATATAEAATVLSEANLKTCTDNTDALESSIATQNEAVRLLKKASDAQAAKATAAGVTASKIVGDGQQETARVLTINLTGECEADMAELAKEARK